MSKTSKLKIIPLGGLEAIGMNITAFEYEDSIVVVDCGLAFPEDDMFGIDAFRDFGVEPVITTEDGSCGIKGLVTDAMDMMKTGELDFDYDYVFCCGPEPMLKAVYDAAARAGVTGGQFSFEERMGCGVGACLVCACKTRTPDGGEKYLHVCKNGPVFDSREVIWE